MREARSHFMKNPLIQYLFPGRAAAVSETAYLESEEAGGRAVPYPHVHVIGQTALSQSVLEHVCEVAWREALEQTSGSAAGMTVHAKEIFSAPNFYTVDGEECGPSEVRQKLYCHKGVTLTPPGGRGPRRQWSGGATRGVAALRSRGGGWHACLALSQLPDADLDDAMRAYHDGEFAAGTQESTSRSGPREWLAAATKLQAIMLEVSAAEVGCASPSQASVGALCLRRREPRVVASRRLARKARRAQVRRSGPRRSAVRSPWRSGLRRNSPIAARQSVNRLSPIRSTRLAHRGSPIREQVRANCSPMRLRAIRGGPDGRDASRLAA